jgi:hypothetical protein
MALENRVPDLTQAEIKSLRSLVAVVKDREVFPEGVLIRNYLVDTPGEPDESPVDPATDLED